MSAFTTYNFYSVFQTSGLANLRFGGKSGCEPPVYPVYPVYLVYLDTSIKTMTKQEAAPAIAPYRHLALTKGELAPTALSAGAAGPGAEGVYPARYSVLPDTGLIGTQGGHEPLDQSDRIAVFISLINSFINF